MKQQQGFILILTLCITAVMSILLLISMQHGLLFHNAANRKERSHQRFFQLEYAARKLIQATKSEVADCWYQHDLANLVIQQLIHKKGCKLTIEKMNYQYSIEDLGNYPCLITLHRGSTKATHHFRLTLLIEASEDYPSSLVQIRVIKPSKQIKCVGKKKMVSLGISSWRYFSDVELAFS
jgi:hypothetical protein